MRSCGIYKKTRSKLFKCSQCVCSICRKTRHNPNKYHKMTKEGVNLAIMDQAGPIADAESKSSEF